MWKIAYWAHFPASEELQMWSFASSDKICHATLGLIANLLLASFYQNCISKNLNNTELSVGLPGCLLPPLRIPLPAGRTGLCSEPIPNLELSIFSQARKRSMPGRGEIGQISTAEIYSGAETTEQDPYASSIPLVTYFEDLQVHFWMNKPSTVSGTNVTRPSRALQPGSQAAVKVQGPVKDFFYFFSLKLLIQKVFLLRYCLMFNKGSAYAGAPVSRGCCNSRSLLSSHLF